MSSSEIIEIKEREGDIVNLKYYNKIENVVNNFVRMAIVVDNINLFCFTKNSNKRYWRKKYKKFKIRSDKKRYSVKKHNKKMFLHLTRNEGRIKYKIYGFFIKDIKRKFRSYKDLYLFLESIHFVHNIKCCSIILKKKSDIVESSLGMSHKYRFDLRMVKGDMRYLYGLMKIITGVK